MRNCKICTAKDCDCLCGVCARARQLAALRAWGVAAGVTVLDRITSLDQLPEPKEEKCANALQGNETWGVVGPLQYDSHGLITHAGIFGTLDQPKHRQWKRRAGQSVRDAQKAVTVSGSAYFVKRSVWEELTNCPIYRSLYPNAEGAFLPTFLFYEESWCSYHAQAHAHEVYYFGEAECIHEWHGSIKRFGGDRAMVESRQQFREMCRAHDIPCD